MEKGGPPRESAPPYPGPPLSEGGVMPYPMTYPQSSFLPGPSPPPGYHGDVWPHPGVYPQPGLPPGWPPPSAGYQGGPHPGMYPQPGLPPGAPPPGYTGAVPHAPVVPTSTTIVTQVMVPVELRDTSGQAVCQHCHQTVFTKIKYTPGVLPWLICAIAAAFGFFLCCWIPFVIDSCNDVEHRCPSCKKLIYRYTRR